MPDYLIGYDVRKRSRLQKIHRKMMGYAVPVQYSIFLFTGTDTELKECIAAVKPILDLKVDDLRCYRLPTQGFRGRLGTAVLPEGVFYGALPPEL